MSGSQPSVAPSLAPSSGLHMLMGAPPHTHSYVLEHGKSYPLPGGKWGEEKGGESGRKEGNEKRCFFFFKKKKKLIKKKEKEKIRLTSGLRGRQT